MRRGGFAAVITVLLALAAGTASDWAGAGPEANRGGRIRDPLLGTWDTGRIRFDRVRASLNAAGYSETEVRTFLQDAGLDNTLTWRFDLTFYREHGVASLIRTGWDPEVTAMPSDGEHVRYRLLPKRRIAITSADPKFHKWREVYSYRITGRTIRFHVLGETDPTLTKPQVRLDRQGMYVMAAVPLKRIA